MRRKLTNAILLLVVLAIGYASYDYVLRDNEDVKAAAEKAACTVKSCGEKHTMTKMDRSPIREAFEFTWVSGVVNVDCGRPQWIVGDIECKVIP